MFRRALRGKYTLVAGRVSEIRTMEGGGGGSKQKLDSGLDSGLTANFVFLSL